MFGTAGPSGREGGLGTAIALRARTPCSYRFGFTTYYYRGHEVVRVVTLQRLTGQLRILNVRF